MSICVIDHPLVHHHLTKLRSVETGYAEFRRLVQKLTSFLGQESTKDLLLKEISITTPLCKTLGWSICQNIGLVPILRAGLGMVDPLLELLPESEVWHLGLYRDESTARPVEYYNNLPPGRPTEVALILDPMLATGGSAGLTVRVLQNWGVKQIKLLSLIAAPEGIHSLQQEFPELDIFVCSVDEQLNDKKYIVPGLGDAGDRFFNTEID